MHSFSNFLSQVIVQLVDNTFEHFSSSTYIEIKVQVLDFQSKIEIFYSDNGEGIAKETRERMFEPFYTTKLGEDNTGLGMHIVYYQVTQKLGGRIEYLYQVGSGAVFKLSLPKYSSDN